MSDVTTPEWAWRDGQFVRWDECRVHARSQAVLTGVSVFEGIRAYAGHDHGELYLFRFADHVRRLAQSLKIARIPAAIPANLEDVCGELLALNGWHEDVHISPFACLGVAPDFGFLSDNPNVTFVVTAVPRPRARAIDSGTPEGEQLHPDLGIDDTAAGQDGRQLPQQPARRPGSARRRV
ncbi:hypothetical protein [Candidatus Nephthysia bennettiae]|uniref:hypothetical protein n=1 Tax=Candidatus Nephthysia bennettiae TaxID=3127016 RepID=UPI0030C76D47